MDLQEKYMNSDLCLQVDEYDCVKGVATKKMCHELCNGASQLHRAFSLFLFRTGVEGQEPQLLIQRRSNSKLTYPGMWSNTCCSHPLANYPKEVVEADAFGVKRAAQRKLMDELRIGEVPFLMLPNIHFLTRAIYFARNESSGNPRWAEYEIDYILISVLDSSLGSKLGDGMIHFNPEEVSDVRWVAYSSLEVWLKGKESKEDLRALNFTPWVRGLFSAGLLQRLYYWAQLYHTRLSSTQFSKEDEYWDRGKIVRLRT
ncbi:unnamed protein product [Calicophoron daubneyi]|uniref:isopentenyl-diphosphate Delta-isomerase n=1 Tax=Calicophoron daubneyi TaxID=300641 RepID=A0AAV2TVS1_CALDB